LKRAATNFSPRATWLLIFIAAIAFLDTQIQILSQIFYLNPSRLCLTETAPHQFIIHTEKHDQDDPNKYNIRMDIYAGLSSAGASDTARSSAATGTNADATTSAVSIC
jgi:hypothetical protein